MSSSTKNTRIHPRFCMKTKPKKTTSFLMPTLYKINTKHVPWLLFFDCELGTSCQEIKHLTPLFCFNPIKRQPFYHILRLQNPFHAIEFATPHVLSSSCLKNTVLTHGIGNKTAVKRRRPSCRRENGHHRNLF